MPKKHAVLALVLAGLVLAAPGSAEAEAENFDGRPAFAEGRDAGYHVWRDGEKWHLRWTTTGKLRRFSGSVTAEGGDLKSLKRIDVEVERRIIRSGRAPRVVVGRRGRARLRGGRAPVVATRRQDKIKKDGDHRIVFRSRTNDDIDGFDFKVGKKVSSLRFVLEIHGKFRPKYVEVGKDSRKVPRLPFVVKLD